MTMRNLAILAVLGIVAYFLWRRSGATGKTDAEIIAEAGGKPVFFKAPDGSTGVMAVRTDTIGAETGGYTRYTGDRRASGGTQVVTGQ